MANFNPKLNLIIGKNGEGKSNFFRGIDWFIKPSILFWLIESLWIETSTIPTCMYFMMNLESSRQWSQRHRGLGLL